MYLMGEFDRRDAVILALRSLQANGTVAENLKVFSDVPLEIPRSVLDRRSHMSLAVVLGATTLGLFAVSFVYLTQHNYALVTGGMPIFSFWATGVVFYELTMLGAILTCLSWFIYESGILLKRGRESRPLAHQSAIGLQVHCAPEQEESIRRILLSSGAEKCTSTRDLL